MKAELKAIGESLAECMLKVGNLLDKEKNPVENYLLSLKWDGVPRVRSWMQYYLGAADASYERSVGQDRDQLWAEAVEIYQSGGMTECPVQEERKKYWGLYNTADGKWKSRKEDGGYMMSKPKHRLRFDSEEAAATETKAFYYINTIVPKPFYVRCKK